MQTFARPLRHRLIRRHISRSMKCMQEQIFVAFRPPAQQRARLQLPEGGSMQSGGRISGDTRTPPAICVICMNRGRALSTAMTRITMSGSLHAQLINFNNSPPLLQERGRFREVSRSRRRPHLKDPTMSVERRGRSIASRT